MLLCESALYDAMRLLGAILAAGSFVAVCAQMPPIVDKASVPIGGMFTVTCDASRFPPGSIPSDVYFISELSVERNVGKGTRELIAQYVPFQAPGFFNVTKNIPTGRHWTVEASGGVASGDKPTDNKATITLELVVRDAKCSDAGMYRCNATYTIFNVGTGNTERSQNLDGACSTGTHAGIMESSRFVRNMFLVDAAMFIWLRSF